MSDRTDMARAEGSTVFGLIVRLVGDDPRGDEFTDLFAYADTVGLTGLRELLDVHGVVRTRRAIARTHPERVRELERVGFQADDDFIDLPSLNQYWHLDVRHLDDDAVAALLEALLRLDGAVSHAYRENEWGAPDVTCSATKDPLATEQPHLEEVAAPWAWTQAGGQGQEIGVVDIETGWWLDDGGVADHEDLAAHGATLVSGVVDDTPDIKSHGTAVLGIIAALNNDVGCSGIAPCLGRLKMVSPLDAGTNGAAYTDGYVGDALVAAVEASLDGDILVIERTVEWKAGERVARSPGYHPAEVDEVTFLAIRVATANWRIVVEAAGNLGTDLDAVSVPFPLPGRPDFERSLDRSSSTYVDSHAIMVSAGIDDGGGYAVMATANHGSRIDCFARGNFIVTTGYNTRPPKASKAQPELWYSRHDLARTSAATAIIAGVAAVVQGMRIAGGHPPFNWKRMRFLLSEPTHGTPPDPLSKPFGAVMPSAKAVKILNHGWF